MVTHSNLHARKKQNMPQDEEALLAHHSNHSPREMAESDDDEHTHNTRKRRKKECPVTAETECAASAVAFFLVLGLFLGYILLHHQHRKVVLHVLKDPWGHGRHIFRRKNAGFHHHFYSGSPRFVTVVMPSVVNPSGRSLRLQSIHETWGGPARAIFVLHDQQAEFPQGSHLTLSEKTSPTDSYSYPQTLLVPETIAVEQRVPRLYHTIRTIYERVNPDFCFFVNDHTFVIPEHLCKFLDGKDAEDDLYAGHALKNGKDEVFNSGAAGYILSRSTMRKLVEKWDANDDKSCSIGSDASKWLQGNPGLVTLQCLNALGVRAKDTRAAGKWHRFHAFPLIRTVAGQVDDWYNKKHAGMDGFDGFDTSYNELLPGEDCCSMGTISFHYVEYKECKALFETRNALKEKPSMTDAELKAFMKERWPSTNKEIGGYSRGLPSREERWGPLLAVLRNISRNVPPSTTSEC